MASKQAWSDRGADDKKRVYVRFGALYALLCIVALVAGWLPVALVAALMTVGFAVVWYLTPDDPPARERPAWLEAMDDAASGPDVGSALSRDPADPGDPATSPKREG